MSDTPYVQGFDTLDDMFAAMAAAEDTANVGLTPGQVALRDDVENTRYWAQALPDWDLVIYGVAQPNHVVKRSASFDVDDNRSRGYLTGTAYSADCPKGEYGDTHVSQVIPISREVFGRACAEGWPMMAPSSMSYALAHRLAQAEQDAKKGK